MPTLYKNIIQGMGNHFIWNFLPFDIPNKIPYPYIEMFVFVSDVKIRQLVDLRTTEWFWNGLLLKKTPQNIVPIQNSWCWKKYVLMV